MRNITLHFLKLQFFILPICAILVQNQPSFGQCTTPSTVNPRVKNISATITSRIPGFAEYLPANYNSTTTKYPLLIYWSGQDQVSSFCGILTNGIGKVINDGRFPETVLDNNGNPTSYIVIAPIVTDPYHLPPDWSNADQANAVITYVLSHYRVNTNKIYETGFSFGAYLVMDHASSTLANASKLAGIIPVSNCYPSHGPDYNARVSNLANANVHIWGIQCTNDPAPGCATSNIQDFVNDVNAIHSGQAMFSAPCDGSHFSWDLAYDPNYAVNSKNVYQWATQFSSSFALPALIKDYSARLERNKIVVSWTSTNESNTDRFILQRSGDNQVFHTIAEIVAAGYSSTDRKYSFVDDQPLAGENYYRLLLIDKDEQEEIFSVKRVTLPSALANTISVPNPAKGSLSVYVNVNKTQRLNIQLLDLNGRILNQAQRMFSPGITENNMDVQQFSHGTYLIRITGEGISYNRKIIIN